MIYLILIFIDQSLCLFLIYLYINYLKTNIKFKRINFIVGSIPKFYGFVSSRLKSNCYHGLIPGFCATCAEKTQAAALKRESLLNPLIIPKKPAFSSPITNCEHTWSWVSDNTIRNVMCDFGMPIHDIQTGLANYCIDCHAIGCLTCT